MTFDHNTLNRKLKIWRHTGIETFILLVSQLPFNSHHGARVLRMPGVPLQHPSWGGKNWGVRVWGTIFHPFATDAYSQSCTIAERFWCDSEINISIVVQTCLLYCPFSLCSFICWCVSEIPLSHKWRTLTHHEMGSISFRVRVLIHVHFRPRLLPLLMPSGLFSLKYVLTHSWWR